MKNNRGLSRKAATIVAGGIAKAPHSGTGGSLASGWAVFDNSAVGRGNIQRRRRMQVQRRVRFGCADIVT